MTWRWSGIEIMAVRSAASEQKGIRPVKDRSLIAGRSELKEFLRHDRVDAIKPKASSVSSPGEKRSRRRKAFGARARPKPWISRAVINRESFPSFPRNAHQRARTLSRPRPVSLLISSPNKSRLAPGNETERTLHPSSSSSPLVRGKRREEPKDADEDEEEEEAYEFRLAVDRAQEMRISNLGWPLGRPSQSKPGERSWPASLLFSPLFLPL